jgi:hypothetical protein
MDRNYTNKQYRKTQMCDLSNLQVLDSPRPKFRGTVIDQTGYFPLDSNGNTLIRLENVLNDQQQKDYLKAAALVERQSGRSGFGQKPRLEICYSPSGQAYTYSRIKHNTTTYPQHVTDLIDIAHAQINQLLQNTGLPRCPYIHYTSGVDILYDATFPRGGSISRHKDDEEDWGMVIVYSLGQTRYLRVRRDSDAAWFNVEASSNSLIAMYGDNFQRDYTHQVDKLPASAQVGARLSLNVRFLRPFN